MLIVFFAIMNGEMDNMFDLGEPLVFEVGYPCKKNSHN